MSLRKKIGYLYTDGGARGNPGPAAIGGELYDGTQRKIASFSEYIGATTNNIAEYTALMRGMTLAHASHITHLTCYLDSELVVRQMNFEYKVKNKELALLFAKLHVLRSSFAAVSLRHIPRERNRRADALVNAALDMKK
ncbi:MAG: hypothetical protein A3B30_04200 [Candidatus Komeilibacteria bacterium RIFCSPLOWO2_01_FULL_52_15]|uniref:RNase H type-1 domain-containing protein n=2 Tax=Candidatus Komeiliibacteriota TaxID=1817908 RepID=A0A1G2BSQ1_9BACT|nr:MAG: hypothetical protein A2677_02440 [Candidatus Komeilibacteria bacterium RIFCSPHIGHO2_01_FULL_52_14]OGY91277.1 MAG: hypothetical protein A3B30_04200 [Candidatus Komeilibacteria bacterium RIFCSPLOWO2_01_FULL_52_15]